MLQSQPQQQCCMRHVQWSDDVLDDPEKQVVRIAQENLAAARRVAKRIRQ
jgi:plasmid stabilization system protein ParE